MNTVDIALMRALNLVDNIKTSVTPAKFDRLFQEVLENDDVTVETFHGS